MITAPDKLTSLVTFLGDAKLMTAGCERGGRVGRVGKLIVARKLFAREIGGDRLARWISERDGDYDFIRRAIFLYGRPITREAIAASSRAVSNTAPTTCNE